MPINEEWHNSVKFFYRFNKDIKEYNKVLFEICREMDVHFHDINTLIMNVGRDKYMLPDGIHYNDEGHEIWGRAVADFIEKIL